MIKFMILSSFLVLVSCESDASKANNYEQNKLRETNEIKKDSIELQSELDSDLEVEDLKNNGTEVQSVNVLKKKIDEILIPTIIGKEDSPKDTWLKLKNSSIEALDLKKYMEIKTAPVYVVGKLKLNNSWGLIYHFQYVSEPIDEENYDLKRCETVLVIYDDLDYPKSDIRLGISELSSGYSKIKSASEITYIYRAEMESIRVKVINYNILDGDYTQEIINFKEFDGSKDGSIQSKLYIEKHLQ